MPSGLGSFVGREPELATLKEWFLSDEARLVTLLGTAGMGKSRLAQELSRRAEDAFPGGIVRCDFSASTSTDDVLRSTARALSVEANGAQALELALASRARCLLIVDGCGHLSPACLAETLLSWLSAAPRLSILATSWRRLRIAHERPFMLAPLDHTSARRLFTERVRAVTDRELPRPDVDQLLTMVEGIPLAIELAATAMGVLTPAQLIERREFLLDMTAADEVWASRPLRQALALSCQTLGVREREVFAACSVFQGTFTFDQVAALVPAASPVEVLRCLQVLTDHSLLRAEGTSTVVQFRMFDSVRHFAKDQFESAGALADTVKLHAVYFGQEARARVLSIEGEGRLSSAQWLLENEENLLAAVRAAEGDSEEAVADSLMWAVAGLRWIGVGRGPLEPYARLCKQVVARICQPGEARGYLLLGAANIHRHLGDLESAARFGQGALDWAQASGHRALEIRARLESARLKDKLGEGAAAERLLEEASALADTASDPWSKLAVFFARPRPEADAIELERISSLAAQSGDPVMMARAEAAMAARLAGEGRNAEAVARADRMRTIASSLGERTWRMQADRIWGMALADQGRLAEARRVLQGALEQSRSIGYLQSEAEALGYLGLVEFESGELDVAASLLREAAGKLQNNEPNGLLFRAALAAVETELHPTGEAAADALEQLPPDDNQRAILEAFAAIQRLARSPDASGIKPSPPPVPSIEARAAERLLRRALCRVEPPESALVVERDALWFRAPGGAKVDMAKRPLLRSLLLLLLNGHREHEGEPVPRETVAAALWPGQRMLPKATANRLAVAVSTLRKAGLSDVLFSDSRGISIRSGVQVVHLDSRSAV